MRTHAWNARSQWPIGYRRSTCPNPRAILWGKADKVDMVHEAVPKEAFLGESEPLCTGLHRS